MLLCFAGSQTLPSGRGKKGRGRVTADCLRHPVPMAGVETIWELHTPVINS